MATHGTEPGDDMENEVVTVKSKANRQRPHFPPYFYDSRDTGIPIYANHIYTMLGHCRCYDDSICTATRMVTNMYMPWTRFPVRNGNTIGRFAFETWKNPLASRSVSDVKKAIDVQCNFIVSADGHSATIDRRPGKHRWFSFWMAVHTLHAFVQEGIQVDDQTILQCVQDMNYHIGQYNIHKNAYINKDLLGEETAEHRKLFDDYYDQLIKKLDEKKEVADKASDIFEVTIQHKTKKDAAVQLLLEKRKLTAELFAKADLIIQSLLLQTTQKPLKRKGGGGATATSKKTKQDPPGPAERPPSPEQQTTYDKEDIESAKLLVYLHRYRHPERSPMDIENLIDGTAPSFSQPLGALLDQMRELSVF